MNCVRQQGKTVRMAASALTILTLFVLAAGAAPLPPQAQTEAEPAVTHNTWTSAAPMPTPVYFPATGVLKNEIYVVGGNDGTGNVADVQVYNPVANTWSAGVSFPTTSATAAAAAGRRAPGRP